MEHIKNYWWVYLFLAIAIYWYFFFGFMSESRYEQWRNKNRPQVLPKITDSYPKPINNTCPSGYTFLQPQCAVAPCPGMCIPILTSPN